jgi:hypothetical protein
MELQLSVVIVNYNGLQFLKNCLDSLEEKLYTISYEIIILDNDIVTKSTYFEFVQSQKNMLTLPGDKSFTPSTAPYLRNPENIVYSYLNNKLINYHQESDFWDSCKYTSDYVEQNILDLNLTDMPNNEIMKKWFNKNLFHKKMIKNLPKNRGIYPLLQAYAKPGIW